MTLYVKFFYSSWAKGFNLMKIHTYSAVVFGDNMFTIWEEQA